MYDPSLKKIELLAPAGNMDALKAAVEGGCDAVYLGVTNFSARAFAGNFTHEEFLEAVRYCHIRGIKVYVATITPFGKSFYDGGNLFKEACRQTVNQWMRTSSEVDGVIDFDALMRDPDAPNQLRQSLQEDWLHPNANGYKAMGEFAAKEIVK